MKEVLFVAVGGALGAISRLKVGGFILHNSINSKFPLSTLIVNVLGCLFVGLISGFIEKGSPMHSSEWRLFLITGVLGGFTTFSAFSLETLYLLRSQETFTALSYAILSVVLGLAGAFIGLRLSGFQH